MSERATTATSATDLASHWGIDPARVRSSPWPATEADVLALDERGPLCELIDGVLVEKPMGWRESWLGVEIAARLRQFVRQYNLGIVVGADGLARMAEGNILIPDVAFTSWARLPEGDLPSVSPVAPDLAVEVLSPSNTPAELADKRADYFASGTIIVWQVDPEAQTVEIFTDPNSSSVLTVSDTLDGGMVLPGFTLPLVDLFRVPQRPR